MHDRLVGIATAINSVLLVLFAAGPNRSSYNTSSVSCESELRELFDTRATLHTYRQFCIFLLCIIGGLASIVWYYFFDSGRRPVRTLLGKGGRGKLQ